MARAGAHLKLAYAEADLTGNGAAPLELLTADRRAIFTKPDHAQPALFRVSLHPSVDFFSTTRLEASFDWLDYRQRTLNDDVVDIGTCEDATGSLCLDGEVLVTDRSCTIIADPLAGEGYCVLSRTLTRAGVRSSS